MYNFRLKFESEHLALTEANSQLESQERRVRQLETAQRISQQTGADEVYFYFILKFSNFFFCEIC
jgi:hypothetical protein